ncbi:MAG: EAL domain-containing protein [Candidatus Thiodiazotropha sp.]|nr:EAL domain-containing protein [Candidatus Thiodiazotropha sp.]MCM8884695.1 EAL domain-containing protein [Candidatus Thiodiazotropha sp.]
MFPDSKQIDDSLDTIEEQAHILYMQAPISNTTVLVTSTIFFLILTARIESSLIGYWVFFLSMTALYRLFLWFRRRKAPESKSPRQWMNHYIFGSALVGISWSLIYPLIYIANDLIISIALFMLAFGIIGASVAILAVSMRAFIVYTYPQAFMLGGTLLMFQNSSFNWLTLALCIYVLMITLFTRNTNQSVLKSIHLQFQNQGLIRKLNNEIDQREEQIKERTTQLQDKNIALTNEVSERKQAESFLAKQKHILELISQGSASLHQILEEIVIAVESQTNNLRGSILLLKGNTLHTGAAPNMPDDYNALIEGLEIGPTAGSCGTAVFTQQRVVVEDIQQDPRWVCYRHLGTSYDFSACWSDPIVDSSGVVLGAFALYYPKVAVPTPKEIQLVESLSQIASLAIERNITETRLRQSAAVFQSTIEGVVITDGDNTILDVNKAFEEITGYSREEVVGHTPCILQSGRHDNNFYQQMWRSIEENRQWRGEVWNRRKDGVIFPEWLNISCIYDNNDNPVNYVGVFSDITSIKRSEEELDHMAHHDPLTDLPNRLLFNSQLDQAIKHAKRNQTVFALLFIDLDRFKNINDSLGHKSGDELLQQLAIRIQEKVRLDDTVARISGDEFVVLLENIGSAENTAVTVEKIMSVFNESFILDRHEVCITASIGISLYPTNGNTIISLMRNADVAMYRAKNEGRNTYQFFTQEMTSNAFERVMIENALRMALNRNEFHLVYQPQFAIENRKLVGVEALIRWQHPDLGNISPAKFIPLAEENGLIHDIGAWVMKTACIQGARWLENNFDFGHIAVNVARPQLQHSNFIDKVRTILDETEFSADRLELEVTEGFIMHNTTHAIQQLEALRVLGVKIVIDDFGTGYSSMSYLKLLPIQKLKIDQSFIRDIPFDTDDMAISEAVIALSKALGLQVIAEGVETEKQVKFLREKGCQEVQGYLFCKPISAQELEIKYSYEIT